MKALRLAVYSVLAATVLGNIEPSHAADNQDACGATLCLAGAALSGKAPSNCNGYIKKYFEIQVFHDGDFSPSRTAKKRLSFLKQCQSDNSNTKNSVNNRYGGAKGL